MAVDIATLGIQIDLLNAEEASQLLDKLRAAADRAGRSGRNLGEAGKQASQGLATVQRGTASLQSALANVTRRMLNMKTSMTAFNTELVHVDQNLNIVGDAATRTGAAFNRIVNSSTLSQMNRITGMFQDTGVAINRASSQLDGLSQRMQRIGRENAFRQLAQEANLSSIQMARLRLSMGDLGGAFTSLGQGLASAKLQVAAIAVSIGLFAKSCIDAQEELKRLQYAYGAVFGATAQAELQKVYTQADRIGLKFTETANAAKGFFAAGKGTTLEKDLQGIFKAITDAGASLQLSTDEVNGALLALGQMISKGSVQAEELRGQLGERLPGAFRLAADAMGMTTAELDKFMADGKLTAEDLLPKLAAALEEKYGEAAVNAANTVSGAINRMENEWTRFKARIMNSGPVVFAVKFVTSYLQEGNRKAEQEAENARIDDILRKQGVKPAGREVNTSPWMSYMGAGVKETFTEAQRDVQRQLEKQAEEIKQSYQDLIQAEEKASGDYRQAVSSVMKTASSTKRKAIEDQKAELQAAADELIKLEKQNPNYKEATVTKIQKETNEAIAELDKKLADIDKKAAGSAKKAASGAAKAAVSQADYVGELERTKNSIDSLQKQLGLDKTETLTQAKIKAEEKYQETISKTNEELAKQVARGSLTKSQAENLKIEKEKQASLQKQLTIKQAEQKQDQKNVQIAQGQIKFYKELGQLSGNYGNAIALQNQLVQKQAKEYREVYGIADDLVNQWVYLQQLQNSQDPFDGAYRGLLKFNAEYADSAKQWESLSYNFGKNFMSTTRSMFDDFIDTGKASFDSFKNMFKQFLKDMAWQALAQPIMLSIVGGVSGALWGTGTAQASSMGMGTTSSGSGDLVSTAMGMGQQYALGEVKNQLFGSGTGSLMGGITDSINSAMASWFPNTFAANNALAAGNNTFNAANAVTAQLNGTTAAAQAPTQTFTGGFSAAFGAPLLGAGIGTMASPFVNNLLGLQNNTGSSIGSMIGGLGTAGVLGTLALANIWNPGGWIAGGLAALGGLLGGGIGSLFGGQKPEEPELYLSSGVNLWERARQGVEKYPGGARSLFEGNGYFAWMGGAQGTNFQTAQAAAQLANQVLYSGQVISNAMEDALSELDSGIAKQYAAKLKEQGELRYDLYLAGDQLNAEQIQKYAEDLNDMIIEQIVTALSGLDLAPLTIAADGLAADTAKELSQAFSKIFSYVNTGQTIEDEELREKFTTAAIGQMGAALENVSFAPLAKAADGFAVNTMEELTSSLEDMFSLYDLSESLQDENAKKAFQQWAQREIEDAFTSVDLSFLRVDFDKQSFTGLQQAYAATQAWKAVQDGINAVLSPASEFETTMQGAADQFDDWLGKLRELGWQEEAIAEVEAKRTAYMAEYQRQLERDMRQNLASRFSSLYYGSDSREASLQSLLFQQANERESWKQQFGETHELYQTGLGIQKAELTQTLLDQFKAMREELLAQEANAVQERINSLQKQAKAEQDAIQKRIQALRDEISAQNKLVNEAQKLSDKFWRLAKSLEEFRRDLWSGENNLMGTRYREAYSQFDQLFEKAMAGDEDAFNELQNKASELLQLGREQLGTKGEYNDLFYEVDQKLKQAQIYAEKQATEADQQLEALNKILDALNAEQDAAQARYDGIAAKLEAQQTALQAQLDALQKQNEQGTKSQYTLEQIDAAIRLLTGSLNTQLGKTNETIAGYDWDRLISEKITDLSRIAYKGDTNWTKDEFLADLKASGKSLEQWYREQGQREGYTLHAIQTTNSTLDYNAQKAYKQSDQNTNLLNSSLLQQIDAIGVGNSSISSLIDVNTGYWPEAISSITGLNGGLASIFSGITGVNTGVGAVNSSLGGVNTGLGSVNSSIGGLNGGIESVNSSIGGLNTGLTSIYDAIIAFSSNLDATVSGSYGGTTTDYGGATTDYGGTTTTYNPSTGNYGGITSGGSTDDEYEKVAMGQGIYGSTFKTERALLTAKTRHMNLTKYNGRNDWTTESVKQTIIDAVRTESPSTTTANAIKYWYEHGGKYEQEWGYYAKGGITPTDRPFWVGEEGPELMMSSRHYGVLSNEASRAIAGMQTTSDIQKSDDQILAELRDGFALLANYLRQVVVKTDKTAYLCDGIKNIVREWNDTGLPKEAEA